MRTIRTLDLLKALFVGAGLAAGYAALRLAGGTHHFDPQILYVPIILATLWAGPLAGIAVGLAAGVLAGPFTPHNLATGEGQPAVVWSTRLVSFAVVGWAVGFINNRLRARAAELAETAQRLERRTAEAVEAKERADWARGELAALSAAALSLIANEALPVVLQRIVDLSQEIVKAKYAALAIGGPDGRVTQLYTSGISKELREQMGPICSGRGLIGFILKGRSIRTRDLAAHPESSGLPDHHPHMRRLVGVPVIYKDRPLGALFLCEPEAGDEFTAEDEQTLTLFAAHAAAAIENADLYEAQRQKVRELHALNQVDAAVLADAGEQEIADLAARQAREVFGARICIIFRAESDALIPVAADGDGLTEEAKTELPTVRIGEGAAGWAALQKEVVAVADSAKDPRSGHLQAARERFGLRSAIAAPLVDGDTSVGVVYLGYAEPRRFTTDETERAARFADRLSLGIQRVRQQETVRGMTMETVIALAESIESRDPYTGGHCMRLVEHAELIAEELEISGLDLEIIRYGAALHDCGKVGVPDSVLKKAGPLTPEDWAAMKLHPYIGGQLCKRVSFLRHIFPIVYHHHERYDGSGYPDGLRGESIPLGARIVAVADAYDSMTSERLYREAFAHEYAMRQLRKYAGAQFDPDCVEAFVRAIERQAAAEPESIRRAA